MPGSPPAIARAPRRRFRAGVDAAPQSVEAHVALARFLAGDAAGTAEAEREFLQAVAAEPTSEMANRAAASFYIATGRDAAAEPFLKTAAAQPNQQLRSTLALADYYIAAHRYAGRPRGARADDERPIGERRPRSGSRRSSSKPVRRRTRAS